jgi:hypothetical protein
MMIHADPDQFLRVDQNHQLQPSRGELRGLIHSHNRQVDLEEFWGTSFIRLLSQQQYHELDHAVVILDTDPLINAVNPFEILGL